MVAILLFLKFIDLGGQFGLFIGQELETGVNMLLPLVNILHQVQDLSLSQLQICNTGLHANKHLSNGRIRRPAVSFYLTSTLSMIVRVLGIR